VLDGGVGSAVAVVVIYMAVDVVGQTIIQPPITATQYVSVPQPPSVSLVFWAYVLGSLGALLAVVAALF
jgi:AI-2 transport protein TqsA